ncbi:MAG: hydrogenase nickel incorporation protein HypB [Planctomycetaceae bacterium]|nr:hydrogenase nickel incorporation protein HypB [Planctomycetaceae bacterium]
METRTVAVNQYILAEKKRRAVEQRDNFTQQNTFVVNLVSSPGAGKTSLLQATARFWKDQFRVAVLVGDLATDRDAERLRPYVPVEQLTTGGACHLELSLVQQGLSRLPRQTYDFLFIENIGNLVCPASHDLGEHIRVVFLSTTEGDDKPGKYPKMFRTSQALVITKSDLLPYVPFSVEAAIADARLIQPEIHPVLTSATKDEGIKDWCRYLENAREATLRAASQTGAG